MMIGWIGLGRMGAPMAIRLLRAGNSVTAWNRTRAKAAPVEKEGAKIVDNLDGLADVDVLFSMVNTGKDLAEVCFGEAGVYRDGAKTYPKLLVDCSTIGMDESADVRKRLSALGVDFLAAPVSGHPRCIWAGKLSSVVSGPKPAFDRVKPLLLTYGPAGAAYAGEGELARMSKIAVNLLLFVTGATLMEVTLLAEKAGIKRSAFLEFLNSSVIGSAFSRYKSPAIVNLDFTTTFPPTGMRKDLDLGLDIGKEYGVDMPMVTATRALLQEHIESAAGQPDPEGYLKKDFVTLIETLARSAGMKLVPENVTVSDGLDPVPPLGQNSPQL
ncbi:MAG: NAD(P)-dependent oxidoreductase [Bauldia sp.]